MSVKVVQLQDIAENLTISVRTQDGSIEFPSTNLVADSPGSGERIFHVAKNLFTDKVAALSHILGLIICLISFARQFPYATCTLPTQNSIINSISLVTYYLSPGDKLCSI